MIKRYFGSYSLQNTIRKVKEFYPECKIQFKEDVEGKQVTFKFSSEDRKKYGLSEAIRTYMFLNGHLILSNGCMDPFKYDKLDDLIETSELDYDVARKKESVEKIAAALSSCQDFHDTAYVKIGNQTSSGKYDIKLTLNDIERAYQMDTVAGEVHLKKLDPNIELKNEIEYKLSELPSSIKYKILKTTHPGLLTVATEYISGMRENKNGWKSAADAYVKSWRKDIYEKIGIRPFEVLADVSESRLVGKFANNPMRHLVLINGMEYAYRENPLEVVPYEEYRMERNQILNSYKRDVMRVCKETGVIAPKAIDLMNVYTGKKGPVVFGEAEETICSIRMERLEEPLSNMIDKINRTIRLHNHDGRFLASLRKTKKYDDIRRIDINENGNITRIDVNFLLLSVSKPYIMSIGHKREEYTELNRLPLTELFIETLKTEVENMKEKPEYKAYKFTKVLETYGFREENIVSDEEWNIYKYYYFPDEKHLLWIDPYQDLIGAHELDEIRSNEKTSHLLDRACQIFDEIF